jgi:thiamine transport system permease protein
MHAPKYWWLPGVLAGMPVLLVLCGALLALIAAAPAPDVRAVLADTYLWQVTGFTVMQAGLSSALSVALAIPVALALARRVFPGRRLLLRAFALCAVLPSIVVVLGIVTVHGRAGWVSSGLQALGLDFAYSPYGLGGILLAHVFFNMPLAARVLLASLEAVPPETWRLASQLGLRPRDILRLIDWPALRPVLPGVAATIFMLCATSFAVVLALGGGPRATTLEVAIYQALRLEFDLGRAVLLALLQLLLAGGVAAIALQFGGAMELTLTERRPAERPDRSAISTRTIDAVALAAAATLIVPPLLAIFLSGLNARLPALLASPVLWRAALNSLGVAAGTVAIALPLSVGLLATQRTLRERLGRPHAAGVLDILGSVILVVPGFVLGTGLFILLRPLGDVLGWALPLVMLVNALMAMPYMLRILGPPMAQVVRANDRLCASLGIAGLNRLRLVEWPALRRPVGLAAALAAALSLGDLGVIALFGSQDTATLPMLLHRLMGAYRLDQAATVALLLTLGCLGLFWAGEALVRWGGGDEQGG